ncbi:MAG: CBS domain-containing protein [Alphaproteobacteria bacterium]
MRVRDLMQHPVVTLDEASDVDVADGLMRMDRIRHLPVVSGGRLVGIVSQRDLFRAGVERSFGGEGDGASPLRLREVMNREVVTAHPDADLASAVEMLLQRRIGCLPVVEDGRLLGLLSETDCLRYLATLLESGD